MTRRLIPVLVLIGAVLVAVYALLPGSERPGGPDASPSATVPPVPVSDEVIAEGRAIPSRTASLQVALPGTVTQVVALGATVAEGDALVTLDPATAEAEIAVAEAAVTVANAGREQARAAVSQATAAMAAADASVDQANAALRRAQAARDLVPEDAEDARIRVADADVDTAEAVLARAEAELDAAAAARTAAQRAGDVAEGERTRAQAALAAAELARDQLTLRAPFAGTVASVDVGLGERATPGLPIVRLADASGWTFETIDMGEEGVARISPGDQATISFDGQPGMVIPGRVERIALYGQDRQGDVAFRVIVAPTGAVPATVRWNMTVTISIRPGS